jgi:oligoendopeptidase F
MDDISGSGVITTKGVRLDAIRDRSQILKSNDSTTRRLGAIAYNEAYSQHAEMLAAILIDITSAKNTLAKLRGFQSAPARSYSAKLQLPESSVKSLLNEMMQHADVLKAYQELQAAHVSKLTGLNQVHSYDLFFWGGYKWVPQSYNDIRQLIQKALTPLGEGYETAFAWLLEPANGALDISGGPNRVNENTSVGYPGVPVSLYMKNYNGALTDVLRLSHEGGHAVHMKLMFDLSIPSYASGPSFMFEAFAMLNELLVLDELRQQAESKEARVYYTQQFLNKLAHELFTSAEEGTFEQQLYDGVSAGKINKRKDIDSLYAGIMNKYDFFFESEPERKSEWINKRLLFDDPLYNVNYLYAMLVTCKLYDQFHQDPQKFATQYNALLKNGFNDSAENLLEKFMGFKLDHEILLNSALKLMQNKSDELIELWRP